MYKSRKLLIALGVVGTAKALGSFISVVFSVLAARALGASEAGYLFLGMTLLTVGSAVCRLGFDARIVRSYGAHGISHEANRVLGLAVGASLFCALLIGATLFIYADPIARHVFAKAEVAPVLRYTGLAILPLTLLNHLGFAFQGVHRAVMNVFAQNLGYLLFGFLAFSVLYLWLGITLDAEQGALILFVAIMISLGLAFAIWMRQPGTTFRVSFKTQWPEVKSNANLWVAMLMTLAVAWSGVLIGGTFVSAAELAQTAAAQRVAVLVVFVLLVCDMFVAPRYARLYAAGEIGQMRRMAKLSTWGMLAISLPLTGAMIYFAAPIMAIFGEGFAVAGPVLIVFVLGQLVNVATGSVGQLLTMCGHEADYRRVTILAGVSTVALTFLLAPPFGVMGIATAMTIGIAMQNIFGYLAVHRQLGFFPGF